MANFFCSSALAFLSSALCFFERGKSTSTSTRLSLAKAVNSLEVSTFLCRALQGGHQSEPVKSSRTSFFDSFAWALALLKSVSHSLSAAATLNANQPASRPKKIFFIWLQYLFVMSSDPVGRRDLDSNGEK